MMPNLANSEGFKRVVVFRAIIGSCNIIGLLIGPHRKAVIGPHRKAVSCHIVITFNEWDSWKAVCSSSGFAEKSLKINTGTGWSHVSRKNVALDVAEVGGGLVTVWWS